MFKLFASPTSPYARKVRMLLAEKNVAYEFVNEGPSSPGSRIAMMNPLGKVPVLMTEDERVVYDSRVIVEYIETVYTDHPMMPAPGLGRVSVRRWEALADGMTDAVVAVAVEQSRDNDIQKNPQWIGKQIGKVQRALAVLNAEIGDRTYCHGDSYSLADIAIMAAMPYLSLRLPAIDWRTECPDLGRFVALHSQRQSFIDTTPPPPPPPKPAD